MTDPRQKLANILREIKVQREAMVRKVSGLRNEHYEKKVHQVMRKYRGLADLELKARSLEHQIRTQPSS